MSSTNTPQVIETLSYEEIRKAMIASLQEKIPDYLILESDPAVKVIEALAYRELLLRQRVNEAARANILEFATGSDLDVLGDWHGVSRMDGETDERYRERIRLNRRGNSSGGTEPRYKFYALSASTRVKDAIIYRIEKSPVVYVAIFGDSIEGTADEELIEIVSNALHDKTVIMTNDTIIVHSAVRKIIDVEANIWLLPETSLTILTTLENALKNSWGNAQALGRDITLSWLTAQLQIEGVHNVEIITPSKDYKIEPNEAAAIGTVKLNFIGRAY